jgi:hypothetical protein
MTFRDKHIFSTDGWNRTLDLWITNPLFYQLLYCHYSLHAALLSQLTCNTQLMHCSAVTAYNWFCCQSLYMVLLSKLIHGSAVTAYMQHKAYAQFCCQSLYIVLLSQLTCNTQLMHYYAVTAYTLFCCHSLCIVLLAQLIHGSASTSTIAYYLKGC